MGGRFSDDSVITEVLGGRRTLSRGASGPAVQRLQEALGDMGFPMKVLRNDVGVSSIDGKFGAQTETAVRNFQIHALKRYPEVKPTGVIDAATMRALLELTPEEGKTPCDDGQPSHAPVPIWKEPRTQLRVVVVKDEHRTFLFNRSGRCVRVFPNAHGIAASPTAEGLKKVKTKLDEASAKAVGRDRWKSERAFGRRILDLCWATGKSSGEELHGTYDYATMGRDVSHGCVRHYNEDIIDVFDAVSVGDYVAIVKSIDDARLSDS